MEKARAFNAFFPPFLKLILAFPVLSALEDYDWESSSFSLVVTKIVRDYLYQLNIWKSMDPDKIHPREGVRRCYSWTPSRNLPNALGLWAGHCWMEASQSYTPLEEDQETVDLLI